MVLSKSPQPKRSQVVTNGKHGSSLKVYYIGKVNKFIHVTFLLRCDINERKKKEFVLQHAVKSSTLLEDPFRISDSL